VATPKISLPVANLIQVYDLSSLANLIGLSGRQLGYFLYKRQINLNYEKFKIPKKSGGNREICAPSATLKLLQQKLKTELTALRKFKPFVTGFVDGRDIADNAEFHVGKRYVLNIDLEDFFGTINFGRVFGLLTKQPYSIEKGVAAAITKAVTFENKLPQGAPTSPILSNLICVKLDSEIQNLCRKSKCVYSRYADDITISTQTRLFPFATKDLASDGTRTVVIAAQLRSIIEQNGFKINDSKTRLFSATDRQEVTGLIVNKRVNVKRSYVRAVRAILNAIETYGEVAAQAKFVEEYKGKVSLLQSLAGKISFIGQIRGKNDQVYRKLAKRYNKIVNQQVLKFVLTPEETAKQAIWVIENESSNQGTAFFLDSIGIVTCAHCVADKNYIFHRDKPNQKFPLTLLKKDDHRDLAVFLVPNELAEIVPLKFSAIAQPAEQSEVFLFGYPNHSDWFPVRVEKGQILRLFNVSGVAQVEISAKIIEGNSGGPITNTNFELVGVARQGINSNTALSHAEFIGVEAKEIKLL
jgi:RNA-directed DNA polymerase